MARRTEEPLIADCNNPLRPSDLGNYVGYVRLRMVGRLPECKPYLRIYGGPLIATVSNKHTLRALAHRILQAIGDEQ